MKSAVEIVFDGSYESTDLDNYYDPDKVSLGSLLAQQSSGGSLVNKFVGPKETKAIQVFGTTATGSPIVHLVKSTSKDWWLLMAQTGAGTPRDIHAWRYNPQLNTLGYIGYIRLTFPIGGNQTIRGVRGALSNYSTGTIQLNSGGALVGTGTGWATDRLSAGCRIGFGSDDPEDITQWYTINSIASNTSMSVASSTLTLPAGTKYVIQDFIVAVSTTNATTTQGGLFLAKGISIDAFGTTVIAAATTVDNIRRVYWIKDASTNTNIQAVGLTIDNQASWTSQDAYIVHGTASTMQVYKHNIRQPLSPLTSGAYVDSSVVKTGAQAVAAGTIRPFNNGRIATLKHGPGNNVKCIYGATTTRIFRIPLEFVFEDSTGFIADYMVESPPGGANTFALANNISPPDYSPSLDRLVFSSLATNNGRMYVGRYNTIGEPHENYLSSSLLNYDGASSASYPFVKVITDTTGLWADEGVLFVFPTSTSTLTSVAYVYPAYGCHWDYTNSTNQRAITPRVQFNDVPEKLYRIYVNERNANVGLSPVLTHAADGFRVLYRTSGISDNTGAWSLIDETGDISGVTPSNEIQFAFEFNTMTTFCSPAKIHSLTVLYESDSPLPSQYQWSIGDSNSADGTFGFVQRSLFFSTVPVHTIKIYRSDTNALLLEQASSSSLNGVFEFWNGTTWATGLGSDVVGTRRRFRPTASLPGGVDIYAKISVG
jgi:hypothetical protein